MSIKSSKFIKRFVPKTLFARSLLILITPMLLIQIISTIVFFDRHWNKMTSRLAYAVSGEIAMISDYIEQGTHSDDDIQNLIDLMGSKLSLILSYDKNKHLELSDTHPSWIGWQSMIGNTLLDALKDHVKRPVSVNVDFQEKWVEIRVQLKDGVLNASLPQRRLYSSSSYIFLLWVFVASSVLLVIAVLFMRNQIRPIRRLAIAAERFGKGREVSDFKLEGAKEVRQAGQAFLDMRTRIQRQISQRTDMLAGVSHDLRTPLTRLKLQLAMLGENEDTRHMRQDIREMENMIDGYLNFVRGEGNENTVMLNVSELIEDIIQSSRREGLSIHLEKNGMNLVMPLRPSSFRRCIANIIGNAAKYGGKKIWITTEMENDTRFIIRIEDDGAGIPEKSYDDVFKPFYRIETSRNLETGGIGLGLPIAMDIVHSHGGKIWLSHSEHGGLCVNIRLPI